MQTSLLKDGVADLSRVIVCQNCKSEYRQLRLLDKMKTWIPSIILILLMFLLISATRIYVGGPDGLEFVWKGELNFADTVVNVSDYLGIPMKDLAASHPEALLSQMDEMGLLQPETQAFQKRHRVKKNMEIRTIPTDSHEKAAANAEPEHSPAVNEDSSKKVN